MHLQLEMGLHGLGNNEGWGTWVGHHSPCHRGYAKGRERGKCLEDHEREEGFLGMQRSWRAHGHLRVFRA